MPKKFQWQESEHGAVTLRTETLTLYVKAVPGGFCYRVGGRYQLRYSLKSLPTLEAAKAKCVRAAGQVLHDELAALSALAAPTTD
jgi:hypothetical protein